MIKIGTPLTQVAKKVLLCGSGELGKEVAIELQRFGVEVIALDRYENAPAMQVAHRSYVLSMLDGARLREIIEQEKPDLIIPEVEAIATPTLVAVDNYVYVFYHISHLLIPLLRSRRTHAQLPACRDISRCSLSRCYRSCLQETYRN